MEWLDLWKAVRCAVAALALVVLLEPWAASETGIPEERTVYRDVSGRVVDDATGQPLAGVPVSLLYETAVTDEKGSFRFDKVPLSHTAEVSIRVKSPLNIIIGCTTLDVPVRFYPIAAASGDRVDIRVIDPASDENLELRLKTVPPAGINAYCNACHEKNPCLDAESYQQVIQTGKDLKGIIVQEDQLEEFKKRLVQQSLRKETYQKIRYQDAHPVGMNMEAVSKLNVTEYKEAFKKTKVLRLVEEQFVTCDTCHTRHVPTKQRQYVLMPFEKENSLCEECHL